MRKYVRVLLALLLTACLLLAAGCGGDKPAPTPAPTQAPTAAPTEAPAANDGSETPAEATPAPTQAIGTEVSSSGMTVIGVGGTGTASDTKTTETSAVSHIEVDDNGWIYIASGYDYIMALQADGTLCGWGRNSYGQVGSGTYKDPCVMAIQPVLKDIVAVDAGKEHTAAAAADGTLYIWGANHESQLGDNTHQGRDEPGSAKSLIETGEKIVDIAPGMTCTFALAEDGTLYGFGANGKGQLGGYADKEAPLPAAVAEDVASIYSAGEFSFLIKKDGSIWGAGSNKRGQLGLGEEVDQCASWTEITTISDVVSFALGEQFTLALKADGTVWAVGRNNRGQLGIGSEEKAIYQWTQVAEDAKAVLAGVETAGMVKNDGTLWMWGLNDFGQVGNGDKVNQSVPVQVLDGVKMADCGQSHGVALKEDGSIWVWGQNKYYQLCDGTTTDCITPKQVVSK
ncbi:MAG: hypothetical protein J5859_06675 [Clostridia bacterium]|nr:hypothetical protein [Clostridia bacterium]